jgi:hypothetical protein
VHEAAVSFDVLVNRYTWFVFLLFTAGFLWPSPGVRKRRADDAFFAKSDSAIRRNAILWMGMPWLVMGLGQLVGGISFWRYYSPRYGGPWVTFFYFSVCIFWIVLAHWIFIGKGLPLLSSTN